MPSPYPYPDKDSAWQSGQALAAELVKVATGGGTFSKADWHAHAWTVEGFAAAQLLGGNQPFVTVTGTPFDAKDAAGKLSAVFGTPGGVGAIDWTKIDWVAVLSIVKQIIDLFVKH
jgi:hypothetical protein